MPVDFELHSRCVIAPPGLGWSRDRPDFRDFTPETPEIAALLKKLRSGRRTAGGLPSQVDLREYFPRVRDQQQSSASASHASVGLLEYFERRAFGKTTEYSTTFLDRTARNLLQISEDAGTELRSTLKALTRFGLAPERHWPQHAVSSDAQPDAFVYAAAKKFPAARYVRLDRRNAMGEETLAAARTFLAAGFPLMLGFPVPSSISRDADIAYRPTFDTVFGGQAVVAVGYDDRRGRATKGALLIRNSWGTDWGDAGYGWLPYVYLTEQLAVDLWTLISPDWLETGEFRRPLLPSA